MELAVIWLIEATELFGGNSLSFGKDICPQIKIKIKMAKLKPVVMRYFFMAKYAISLAEIFIANKVGWR